MPESHRHAPTAVRGPMASFVRPVHAWFQAPVLTILVTLLATLILATGGPAAAQIGSYRYSSVVIDAGTGTVLSAVNADERRYPASLVKVMTIYMVFEAVRDRRVSLQQIVPVSPHAASMAPTKLGLMPRTRITVEEAVLGLITRSANDAAAALAELLGGTEDRFAQMMTLRARALGMTSTRFENASGLPDLYQVTTARDMAILARRMIADFPTQYRYFSTQSFTWHGRSIHNHHQLLHSYAGADGLKTGYTQASGYNLITSAVRGGTRLIGVVMGGASGGERDAHMVHLLNAGFERLNIAPERRQPPATLMVQAPPPPRAPLLASAQAASSQAANTQAAPAPLPRVVTPQSAPIAQGSTPPASANTARTVGRKAPALTQVAAKSRPAERWAIQVGSFAEAKQAREAAANARRLTDGGTVHVAAAIANRKPVWRAQIISLSGADAQSACQALSRRKTPCMVVKPENL